MVYHTPAESDSAACRSFLFLLSNLIFYGRQDFFFARVYRIFTDGHD